MARNYGKRYYGNKGTKGGTKARKKSTYDNDMTSFAYKMGLVQRGLDAGNTKVADSYNAGREKKTPKPKKPLY